MKVVIVSQFFHPEPAITANELCRRLVGDGHEVHVVTGFPNRPGGQIFEGYRQRFGHTEEWEGATVHRVPLIINHDRNPVRRIGNFVSFATASLLASRVAVDADVTYVYATPMTAAVAPRLWNHLWGTPYVLHVQDLWPESVTASGMLGRGRAVQLAEQALNGFLGWLYRGASEVVAIAPTMAKTLVERGVAPERVMVSLNWADEASARPVQRRVGDTEVIRFVYAGNIGVFQNLSTLVAAAQLISDDAGVHIDVFGDGTEFEELAVHAESLRTITFHGRVPREQMSQVYEQSDYQLITLKDLPLFRGTIPSKFQGAMAAGIPVITCVPGDVSDLVNDNGVGFTARPEDPESLAQALTHAARIDEDSRVAMRCRAQQFYRERMSAESGYRRLCAALERAAASGARHVNRPLWKNLGVHR